MSLKITVEYNGERITVEKEGEVDFNDLMGALKSGLQAAKVQWKGKE